MSVTQPVIPLNPSSFTLTRRTILAGENVYLVANISRFGPGTRRRTAVPWRLLGVLFAIGALMSVLGALSSAMGSGYGSSSSNVSGLTVIGALLLFASIGLGIFNIVTGLEHGLIIGLNSGEVVFFKTEDRRGLTMVVDRVRALLNNIESDWQPMTVVLNQNAVHIQAGAIMSGNLTAGSVGGGMHHSSAPWQ